MIKLLKHNFKTRRLILIILSFISFLLTMVITNQDVFIYSHFIDSALDVHEQVATNPPIVVPTVMACILATIVPIFEFNFKMRKVNIDQYYSLPIKREKLYTSTFIFGFIEVIIPVTISYLYGVLAVFIKPSLFHNIHLLSYFFVLLSLTYCIYSIVSFVYTRNNTIIDGIINLLFVIFLGMILISAINCIRQELNIQTSSYYLQAEFYSLYSPFIKVCDSFDLLLCSNFVSFEKNKIGATVLSSILFTIVGIACFVLFVYLSKKEKAENCLQISNSWISYKTMIPIYTVCVLIITCSEFFLSLVFTSIASFFAYVIYQRSFMFKKKNLITMICSLIIGFLILFVAGLFNF